MVFFNDVLEHVLDPWTLLQQVHDVLAPDGTVVAAIPSIQYAPVVRDLLRGRWDYRDTGTLDRTHVRFLPKPRWWRCSRAPVTACSFVKNQLRVWRRLGQAHPQEEPVAQVVPGQRVAALRRGRPRSELKDGPCASVLMPRTIVHSCSGKHSGLCTPRRAEPDKVIVVDACSTTTGDVAKRSSPAATVQNGSLLSVMVSLRSWRRSGRGRDS